MKIVLTNKNQPLSDDQLSDIERRLGVAFPIEYRLFLSTHNVSQVGPNKIEKSRITTSIDVFFGSSKYKHDDLVEINKSIYYGRLPEKIIAIGYAAGGNLICLHSETGQIFFWDHEQEHDDIESSGCGNMTLLASTFGDFLNLIEPREVIHDSNHSSYSWKSSDFNEIFKDYLKKQ